MGNKNVTRSGKRSDRMKNQPSHTIQSKVIILGDQGVGKTFMIMAFERDFDESYPPRRTEVDVIYRTRQINDT